MKERLLVFVRGLLMGAADIIPGVSGGTIALITGIYERFIFAVKGLNIRFLAYLLRGERENAKKHLFSMDLEFLITLGFGIFMAFMVLSKAIGYIMAIFPSAMYAFFFGLILASAGFVYRQLSGISLKVLASGAAGFMLAFLFAGIGTLQATHSLPVVFISGLIAVCSMIIPGISGAFMLFFLGQYEYMIGAFQGIDIITLSVFMTGAVIGLFSMARVLGYLLKRHKNETMSFLVGVMLGALRVSYDNIVSGNYFHPFLLVSGAAGFFAVVLLERLAKRVDAERPIFSLP